jgi:hypothetical protein
MPAPDKQVDPERRTGAAQTQLSRRELLPTLIGSAAIVAAAISLGEHETAIAQSKTSQAVAKYQDHPNAGNSCSLCNYFLPPHSCQLVEGTISPTGWCSFFAKKP